MAGADRLPCSRVIFLRQWASRKQSSGTEHCFPHTHLLRKITKPLSSPWRFLKIFSGGGCGKSNPLSEAAFPASTPLKNRRNRGGDDRQVSQNGMPFCTGCTLSGHILNLQGSVAPLDPSLSSPKKETAKHPLEVSTFHFRIRWGMYSSHFGLCKQMSTQAFCSPCALYHR